LLSTVAALLLLLLLPCRLMSVIASPVQKRYGLALHMILKSDVVKDFERKQGELRSRRRVSTRAISVCACLTLQ
jgi:hypothetical protein